MTRHTDPKIDRIRTSPLGLGPSEARWLAATADERTRPAGTVLADRHFAHVVLDGPDAGTVVRAGTDALVLREQARVLVLRDSEARRLAAPTARGASRRVADSPRRARTVVA